MKKPTYIDMAALRSLFAKKGLPISDESLETLIQGVDSVVQTRVNQEKNKKRLAKIDATKERIRASEVLSEAQIASLPEWVRRQLADAHIVGSSGQVIQVPDGRKYHLANPLNHLSGGEWTYFLNSVVSTRYPTSGTESYAHAIRKPHPSPKPPQLMQQIIEFFTKEDELVLDYFMGVGGTLLGASLANRRAVGIDLNPEYIDLYKEASESLSLEYQTAVTGDSLRMLKDRNAMGELLADESLSLIAIDPPYGDMMSREKTGEAAKKKTDTSPTPFTNLGEDLGNLPLNEFFPAFRSSVEDSMVYLKEKGHIVVFIKDLQPDKANTNLLHARVIADLHGIDGLRYLGTKIWADNSVNLYPYGYPFSFVANQIHQYIMIFKKES